MIDEGTGGRTRSSSTAATTSRLRILAMALWVAMLGGTAGFIVISHLDGPLSPFAADVFDAAGLVLAATAGAALAWKLPHNPLGWVFLAITPLVELAAGSSEYATYALAIREGGAPLGRLALWVSVWAWVPALALAFMVVPLLLPGGRLPSAAWRPYLWFLGICAGLYAVINMVAPISADAAGLPSVGNPYGIARLQSLLSPLLGIGDFIALLFVLVGAASLLMRYRRADAEERARFAWLVIGGAPLAGYVLVVAAGAWLPGAARVADPAFALCAAAVPVAAAVGILRPHLLDAALVVRRGALAMALLVTLAVLVAVATVLSRALPADAGALTVLLPAFAVCVAPRRIAPRPRRDTGAAPPKH
jgi:hypothetical protein